MDTLYLLINGPSVANPRALPQTLSTSGGTTERGGGPHKGTAPARPREIEG